MLEFMTQGNGNILGIRATGKLSDEDYQHVLAPRVQTFLEQFHTLRVLFLMDETFQGWSARRGRPGPQAAVDTITTAAKLQPM